MRARVADRGRPPLPVSVFPAPTSPGELSALGELGVSRAVFTLPTEDLDQVVGALDDLAKVMAAV